MFQKPVTVTVMSKKTMKSKKILIIDVKKDKDVKEGSNPEEGEKDSADQTNENAEIPVDLLFSKKY